MRAVYALNRPPGSNVAHLALDGADRALCGTMPGEPAAAVSCRGCASRWAYSTSEGRAAMHGARREMIVMALHDAMLPRRPGDYTRRQLVAELFGQPPPLPRIEVAGILTELRDLGRRYDALTARLAALTATASTHDGGTRWASRT